MPLRDFKFVWKFQLDLWRFHQTPGLGTLSFYQNNRFDKYCANALDDKPNDTKSRRLNYALTEIMIQAQGTGAKSNCDVGERVI